jgi:SAM-dependent methyltransferase
MDAVAYAVEAAVEQSHWWFVGRRRLFARRIERLAIARDARVLDLGTSTGTNLRMLRDIGMTNVVGLDLSDEAIRFCREKGLGKVHKGDITAIPFPDRSFDMVLATDIIEHVDADEKALEEVARILKPGGRAIITVPAFTALWGPQDDLAFHKRRYRMVPLVAKAERAGLRVRDKFYFNFLLFAPIYIARRILSVIPNRVRSENEINGPLMNRILTAIFEADLRAAPYLQPPFGVSIFLLVERPTE